jgi:hypothetical protein
MCTLPSCITEMQVDGFSLDGQKNSLKRFAEKIEDVKLRRKLWSRMPSH